MKETRKFSTISTALKTTKMKGTPWNYISTMKYPKNYNKLYNFMDYMNERTGRTNCMVCIDSYGYEQYHDLKWCIDNINFKRKFNKEPKITTDEAMNEAVSNFIELSISPQYEDTDYNFTVTYFADCETKEERLYDVRSIFTRITDKGFDIKTSVEQSLMESKTEYFINVKPVLLIHCNKEITNSNIEFVGDMIEDIEFDKRYDYVIFNAEIEYPDNHIKNIDKPVPIKKIKKISKKTLKKNSKKILKMNKKMNKKVTDNQLTDIDNVVSDNEVSDIDNEVSDNEVSDNDITDNEIIISDNEIIVIDYNEVNEIIVIEVTDNEIIVTDIDNEVTDNDVCKNTNNGLEVKFKYWIEENDRLPIMECINKAIDKNGVFKEFIEKCNQILITNKLHVGIINTERIEQHFNMILKYAELPESSVIHVYTNKFNDITKYTKITVEKC